MAQSAADREIEARADVERIARAFYEAVPQTAEDYLAPQWADASYDVRDRLCAAVRVLLIRDVIRVGKRPHVERPMEGQLEIES